jgi:photosystem II stability/assembly factor-like uncharacterized protein
VRPLLRPPRQPLLRPLRQLLHPGATCWTRPHRRALLASRGIVTGLGRAGKRVVAVGQRGHVLISDDAGEKWQQSEVPVSADLVAVHFPDAEAGWAVGHDGVILNSTDGGRTWVRQLDGRTLGNV